MNQMEKFLNFGAVVKINRSYDDEIFKFIELIKSVGFLNEYIEHFEKNCCFNKEINEFSEDTFWHYVELNDGNKNDTCLEFQWAKGFTWGNGKDYLEYDNDMEIITVDELIKACNKEELFKYICSRVLPLFETEFLCTYLTLNASFVLPLIYRISIKLNILPPTLQNTNWFMIGTSSILSPILVYLYFRYKFNQNNNANSEKDVVKKSSLSAVIGLLMIFICFMLGLFKYEPISILSNSMVPFFERGDVIIYEKMSES